MDPLYNTGNDFIYADDFMRSQEEENERMGMFDEDENRLFKNTDITYNMLDEQILRYGYFHRADNQGQARNQRHESAAASV